MKRGFFILILLLVFGAVNAQPNIVIIFADDLGYGDLGCYGHPTMETPNLDRLAAEGMRLTQFYVGADVCTPSRAALLTGRLPIRYGLAGTAERDVFFPNSANGLPQSETTLATALKELGYTTGIIGKWHLGHQTKYMPNAHGFDYYFGIPYSNGMIPRDNNHWPPLPLYRNEEVIETGIDQTQLTKRYTKEAVEFIERNKDKPFFLYYPNNFPHIPLHVSEAFDGHTKRGLYGDVVAELDWSVGEIIKALKSNKLDSNTLVFFTSDNGPWLQMRSHGGSAGLLFEGKGSAYEGGMREPAIAWWPGQITGGRVSNALATTMDLFPTVIQLAGGVLQQKKYDGVDMMPLLTGQQEQVREAVYYYHQEKLFAIRKGPWKAHFITKPSYSKEPAVIHDPPLLYNLDIDPSEKYNVNNEHPDIIEEIRVLYRQHQDGLNKVPDKMEAVLWE